MVWSDAGRRVRHRAEVEEVIDFLTSPATARCLWGPPLRRPEAHRAGRALVKPVTALDEPAAGLNHEETEDLAAYMMDIRRGNSPAGAHRA